MHFSLVYKFHSEDVNALKARFRFLYANKYKTIDSHKVEGVVTCHEASILYKKCVSMRTKPKPTVTGFFLFDRDVCGGVRGKQAVDEVNKKDYALKMVRIPRGRSGQLANEEASVELFGGVFAVVYFSLYLFTCVRSFVSF